MLLVSVNIIILLVLVNHHISTVVLLYIMRYAGTSSSTTSSSEAMAAAAAAVALSPLAARRASNNHISPLSSQLHEYDIRLKIIIIGDAGSGKSCIIKQFLDGIFNGYESAHTIGIEFASKIIKVNGKRVKLQIWDTAGQERYRTVTRSYYKGAAGVVLVYDITCRDSYNHIPTWLQDAKRETGEIDNIPIIILGNKKDLSTNSRQVSFLEASRFAQENSVLFMETSAATGEGIQEVFRTLTTRIFSKIDEGVMDPRCITTHTLSTSPPKIFNMTQEVEHKEQRASTISGDGSLLSTLWGRGTCIPPCWGSSSSKDEEESNTRRMDNIGYSKYG